MVFFRKIEKSDYPILREMLYEAIYVPEGMPPCPESIVDIPEIAKYVENWGRDNDFGLIAEVDNNPVGAIWGRLFDEKNKGYGFVDQNTPELSMAVKPEYRNQGIGSKLLLKFFDLTLNEGYSSLSLSVDKRNPACSLYKRMGFEICGDSETAYTMRLNL